jgi:hypothetical protein
LASGISIVVCLDGVELWRLREMPFLNENNSDRARPCCSGMDTIEDRHFSEPRSVAMVRNALIL